ncbi:MAG TPA: iron-containing redox enzyme family protein [Mycobacteriales bacterium]|nr:iron-containing redox enzyme family protein [Mycobacteriales bacterium]
MTVPLDPGARPALPKMQRLADRLLSALDAGPGALEALVDAVPVDRRDRFETLLTCYDLSTADLTTLGARARFGRHPAVAAITWRLEQEWLTELHRVPAPPGGGSEDECLAAMRALAARDRLPAAYEWVARDASYDELVQFLALEGGPDGGFDDLVAACQIGLAGEPKLEMARNYWDEMGNGAAERVHTVLHDDLVRAIDMPRVPRSAQPVEALERAALGGLFAANHWLQPEMVGALGLIELQAGPRCRKVLAGLERTGAGSGAIPFYAEHAEVDPRHGQDWLVNAIAPLVRERPEWGSRMLRGAAWRSHVNAAFFERLWQDLRQSAAA